METAILTTLTAIRRAGSAGQQGPLWELVTADGEAYRSARGAQFSFAVGNPGMREGSDVLMIIRNGRALKMWPAVFILAEDTGNDIISNVVYSYLTPDGTRVGHRSPDALTSRIRRDVPGNPVIIRVDTRRAGSPDGVENAVFLTTGHFAGAWTFTTAGEKISQHDAGRISPATRDKVIEMFRHALSG